MLSLKRNVPIWAVVVLVLVAVAGSAAAITIVNVDNDPLNPGSGTVDGSADLTLETQSLVYSGTNITATDVTVNNTASSDHTGDIQVVLKDGNGAILETKETTGVTFTQSTATTTTVTFDSEHSMADVASLDVVVEETG